MLGHEISMPVLVAPVAFQRLAHPDGEVAMARAARDAGTIMCLSTIATASPAEVAETGAPRWFQLYAMRDHGLTVELIEQARDIRVRSARPHRRCSGPGPPRTRPAHRR